MIALNFNEASGNPTTLFVNFRYEKVFDRVDENGVENYVPASVVCTLYNNPDGLDPLAIGDSFCHWKDNFSKITGRKIAFERAVLALDVSKAERRGIWSAFTTRVKV